MVDTIKELAELSGRLNQKSDKLNELIASINQKLAALNFGVEAWLVNSPLEPTDPYFGEDDERGRWPLIDGTLLGYARVNDEYQLAVKEATLAEFDTKGNMHPDDYEITKSWNLRPLLKASRTVRAGAMGLIPDLLDEITTATNLLLNAITKAERAAKNL